MLRQIVASIAVASAFFCGGIGAVEQTPVCPRLVLVHPGDVDFTSTEKTLLCGDPKVKAWDNIPDNQAIFHLKSFIQNRGYYNPTVTEQGAKLVVNVGEKASVKEFIVEGAPEGLPTDRLRHVVGETLTPALLDETKSRLMRLLEIHGYPCGSVELEGAYATGRVRATLKSGLLLNVSGVSVQPVEHFHSPVLSRYHAFETGEPYNGDLLGLTVGRTLREGIVQSTHFTNDCKTATSANGIALTQGLVEGPARIVSAGVGVDTERGPILRGSWRNARMGATGSQMQFAANISWREQEVTGEGRWYLLPSPSRFYFNPSLLVRHTREQHFESYLARATFAPATTFDTQTLGVRTFVGPTVNYVRTVVGSGPAEAIFLSLRGELNLEDHRFEIHRTNPREGVYVRLETDLTFKNVLSPVNAQLARVRVQRDWNLGHFDPPFLVVSLRAGLAATATDETVGASALPTTYRHFLGGSTDLRGFGRQELPSVGGALTAAFGSIESRFADLLPWGLQPLVFLDGGLLGERPFSLNSPLYFSPGLGVRWQTQIGVIRGTFARGWVAQSDAPFGARPEHIQFYFSFGEEF